MANIPEFHFDFEAVEGQAFEEAAVNLFKQMEDHYNAHIKPAPIVFGGKSFAPPAPSIIGIDPAKPGEDRTVVTPPAPVGGLVAKPPTPSKLVRMKDDYEIKNGADLGLKEGYVLTGVNDKDVEVFDFLVDYTPGDQIVTGESAKYDLGRKK